MSIFVPEKKSIEYYQIRFTGQKGTLLVHLLTSVIMFSCFFPGETQVHPASPILLLLSTDGLLLAFHMMYNIQGLPNLNRPAEPLNPAGMRPPRGIHHLLHRIDHLKGICNYFEWYALMGFGRLSFSNSILQ